jgi:hypothetical protein
MRAILFLILIFICEISSGQELDIFQNDSIYARNKISSRTMYSVDGKTKQKELVTHYNISGQKIKQYWYWNGDKKFHNVETFIYSPNKVLTSLINTFADGTTETTKYVYEKGVLKWEVTIDKKGDTCDYRIYPNKMTTIKRWYRDGKIYRVDTTIFEKDNIKLEYFGTEYSNNSKWHYKFINEFDTRGNLLRAENRGISLANYSYDNKDLLRTKTEVFKFSGNQSMKTEYVFDYK